MTDAPPPIPPDKPKNQISTARIAIWVIVTGVALYLIISGVVGILVKGS
ncbi:hypothetical protein BH10ACT7_BH10ACT7_29190 [soil metagenome]